MMKKHYFLLLVLSFAFSFASAQEDQTITITEYQLSPEFVCKTSGVKNQQLAGTCWSYATVSFLESELLRMGMGEFDFSEIWFARCAYYQKAIRFIRLQGKANFSQGGQAHDVMNVIREFGVLAEADYKGLEYGSPIHNHTEVEAGLLGYLKSIIEKKESKLTTGYRAAINGILDAYFGVAPQTVTYSGKGYTPKELAVALKLKPDDYVELTSYSHHPFYKTFDLEIPDNWSHDQYYNVPIDELVETIVYALKKGYSITWDGDVSEKTFHHVKGLAFWPEIDWDELSQEERKGYFEKPGKEKVITQELRQETFDEQTTTDDHLMHLTGVYKDQNGTRYFQIKNSWGSTSNKCGGFLYMSESFLRLKTVAVLLHKEGIPSAIQSKLNIR
ncbi:MAG: C1 family peptidase [Bacteroidetes bacterium]|nr:C1 family peptidase [Bacteroidota bacterium]MBU1720103.1 C1 family peptidase [Bacteroidota bacterium]